MPFIRGQAALSDASGQLQALAYPPTNQSDLTESLQPDPDKTVARRIERLYIGRDNPDASIVLVSAGPDLKFGRRVDPTSGLPPTPEASGPYNCFLQSLDNVYSTGGHRMKRRGFTLIELLVAIGIIVLLSVIALASTRSLRGSLRFSTAVNTTTALLEAGQVRSHPSW